jgi:hypothetical protein
MAEAKKDDKKSGGSFGFEEVMLLILGLITIFFVTIPQFANIANPTDATDNPTTQNLNQTSGSANTQIRDFYDKVFNEQKIDENTQEPSLIDQTRFRVTDIIKNIFYALIIIAIFFTILFLILKNFFAFKLKVVAEEYNKTLGGIRIQTAEDAPDTQVVSKSYVPDTNGIDNPKWNMIQGYAQSGNPAELRLSIIEADIMLFDVLRQSGFRGENIGDVLKNINKSQLATIDDAWRAHKVRNELAHQGSNFALGRTDAEDALASYKKVFDELGLI